MVVVALNVAVVAAALTVTDAGTVSVEFVLDSVTTTPPPGAGLVKVTVHVVAALGPRVAGLQASDETAIDAARVIVAFAELLL